MNVKILIAEFPFHAPLFYGKETGCHITVIVAKCVCAYASDQSWDSNRATDWYWSSTIYGKGPSSGTYEHFKYPFDISKNGWTSNQQSSAKCRVRVVLAF